jgi:dynein heavy chain
MYKPIA